jgi:5-methylcytosine-specific restriction endonuclease McrA
MDYKRSEPFYHSRAWKDARKQRLMMDNGFCTECMAEFERGERLHPRRAVMVHHVLPITERPDLALDLSNMRSLCDMHHNREHPEKGGRGNAGRTKVEKPAKMRVIKV